MVTPEKPPELTTSRWFNTDKPLSLETLRGKVIVLSIFQMLCPGCVQHGLPLTKKLFKRFNSDEVAVIGLHSVFEHHKVMDADALEVFIKEYDWRFPIGIDEPENTALPHSGAPKTMRAYELRGTPTILLFDRQGRLRRHYYGQPDEILLGAEIMALSIEPTDASRDVSIGIETMLSKTLIMPGLTEQAPSDPQHDAQSKHEHGPGCDHS